MSHENTQCPQCNNIGQYETDNQENTYCQCCGLIIETHYKYVAGHKIKTLTDIQIEKQEQEQMERWKKCKKTTYSETVQQ